jgi:hypothetical protein
MASMVDREIICPDCLTPAALRFEFGSDADLHAYYLCDACGHGCAVQQSRDGLLGRRSAWSRPPMGPESLDGSGE